MISPWRIRVTVDAEREDGRQSSSAVETPSRRKSHRTVTTQVPLKGGDESPTSPSKRPRGRPRKSLDSPVKRPGTPKPLANKRRRKMTDILDEEANNENVMLTTSKIRGRVEKKADSAINDPAQPTEEAMEFRSRSGGPRNSSAQPKQRSRGRRKAITPIKFAVDQTSNESDNVDSPNSQHERALKAKSGNASPSKNAAANHEGFVIYSDSQGYKVPGLRSNPPTKGPTNPAQQYTERATPEPSGQESVLEAKDEAMWRSMIRPSFRSPQPTRPSPLMHGSRDNSGMEQTSNDPTDDHEEFDSIMESEGFSMISTSSLPSAGQHGQDSMKSPENNGVTCIRSRTPINPPISHTMPPPPAPPKPDGDARSLEGLTGGTPKLLRVVRAGNALNGAIEPTEALQGHLLHTLQEQPLQKSREAQKDTDDVFGGFGAGTRRELRAGLRLGEELAKHYLGESNETPMEVSEKLHEQEDRNDGLYPKLPTPESQPELDTPLEHAQSQIPGDERIVDENQMSCNAESPASSAPLSMSQDLDSFCSSPSQHDPIENTIMREREAQWQREREAISREINMANSSQVIVINSDDEQAASEEEDEDYDIWQEEANSFEKTADPNPSSPQSFSPKETAEPTRAKLPSPWRRDGSLLYSDELTRGSQSSLPCDARNGIAEKYPTPIQPTATPISSPLIKQESATDTPAPLSNIADTASPVNPVASSITPLDSGKANPCLTIYPRNNLPHNETRWIPNQDKDHSLTAYPSPEASSSSLVQDTDTSTSDLVLKGLPLQDPTKLVISKTTVESSRTTLFGNTPRSATREVAQKPQIGDLTTRKRHLEAKSPQASRTASRQSCQKRTKRIRPSNAKKLGQAASASKSQVAVASVQQPSFLDRLTSVLPTFSFRIPFATFRHPFPQSSVDGGPLPSTVLYSHLPWTHAHFAYLYPYYSIARTYPQAYPFSPKSAHADLVGQITHNQCGWSKPCEEWEIGVVDRFLLLLRKFGRRRDQSLDDVPHLRAESPEVKDEGPIAGKDVVVKMFQLWVGGVVRGECAVGKGTTGEVLEGDRMGEKWEWPRDRFGDGKAERKRVLEWGMLER